MRILVFEDLALQAAIYNIPIKTLTKYRGILGRCIIATNVTIRLSYHGYSFTDRKSNHDCHNQL
jgi:hypothetical protein